MSVKPIKGSKSARSGHQYNPNKEGCGRKTQSEDNAVYQMAVE